MYIDKSKSIIDIQKDFQSVYPGLKIEFYKTKHDAKEGSGKESLLDPFTPLSSANNGLRSNEIDIDGDKKVIDLEQEFEEKFGLHVQIFRRSKDLWLQTTVTDEWSLEVQNRKGVHSTMQ